MRRYKYLREFQTRSIETVAFSLISLVIIAQLADAYTQEKLSNVQFSVVAKIGVQEAKNKDEEPYQLASILSIDCDTAGNLYVLDYKDVCVKVFDQSGRFMRRMFKGGQGPEELSNPYRLILNRLVNRLFVVQEYGFQMKEFETTGAFCKSYGLPEQIFYDARFMDENRLLYISRNQKREANIKIFNIKTLKVEKEFAVINIPEMSQALQKLLISNNVLWTCPGDKMELKGYDLKSGNERHSFRIPEKYRASELIKGSNWQAVRIYNFGQAFMIDAKLFVLVIKQDFPPPRTDWPTEPKKRLIDLYCLENNDLQKILGFPKTEFFLDYHTTWRNRLIISSSGYDLFPQIWILQVQVQKKAEKRESER